MATEQTANGVVLPEAAGAETTSSIVQDPTVQGAAPLTTPDTSTEAPAAVEGAAGKGLVTAMSLPVVQIPEGRICSVQLDKLGQKHAQFRLRRS